MPGTPMSVLSRREFLWFSSLATAGLLAACATNPVTGKQQLMLISEDQEVQIDKQYSPYQFSADYGKSQDKGLNDYIDRTGKGIAARTHRTQMPYNFQAVNATYINAYAFPGGSIACTRGILLSLDNEAELAALLGHELGHVNARHTAEQMSKGMLTQAVVGGLSVVAGSYGNIASQLGQIGAGALLASYSRDNERQADALGLEYMVASGYSPQGMVGLMEVLQSMGRHKPSAIELMFATHPMSDERYNTAIETADTKYQSSKDQPIYRERYMDHTAELRSQKGAIEEMQKGQKELAAKNFSGADSHFRKALKIAPNDYTALVMLSTSQLVQKKWAVGRQYAEMAQKAYPQEAQAYHLSGFAKIQLKDYDGALGEFSSYDKVLGGNPNTVFFKGYAYEGMKQYRQAGGQYQQYLQLVQQGDYAKHSYNRLQEWKARGYI
ncbi:MAG: M48 family metalloprotease [Desulfobacterales bacterium]|nr:M48 family metalloprotease [Desulfobacterales bacterium]